jgi:hypothetical protein
MEQLNDKVYLFLINIYDTENSRYNATSSSKMFTRD